MSLEEDEPTPGDSAAAESPLFSVTVTLSHPQLTTIESTTAMEPPPLFGVLHDTEHFHLTTNEPGQKWVDCS